MQRYNILQANANFMWVHMWVHFCNRLIIRAAEKSPQTVLFVQRKLYLCTAKKKHNKGSE